MSKSADLPTMNETSKRYLAFHTPQGNLLGEIRMPERPVALVLMLRADNAVADREQASRLFAQGCAVMSIDLLTSDEARFADNRQNIPKHVARILDLLDLCRRDAEFADLPLILLAETDACPAALRAAMQRDQRAGDGKPEARAALRLGILALNLLEGIADLAEGSLRDTDAGIGDLEA